MFYTEGSEELQKARLLIAKFSLPRSQYRLEEAKRRRSDQDRLLEDQNLENYLNAIGPYEVKES